MFTISAPRIVAKGMLSKSRVRTENLKPFALSTEGFLVLRYTIANSASTRVVKDAPSSKGDRGVVTPKTGSNVLISKPKNMINATLRPTAKRAFSILLPVSILRSLIMINPGRKAR
jgi:hypothetical protein